MAKGEAWRRVLKVIRGSDVVVEVVDARFPERSKKLERIVKKMGKKLLLVVNKIDLVGVREGMRIARNMGGVAFCGKTGYGRKNLMRILQRIARESGRDIRVGVVGKPNVGKSTLINRLKGKKSAKTSPEQGFTRGEQWIRIAPNILLIDTPGVITERESEEELALKDALRVEKLRDPVKACLLLFEKYPQVLEKMGVEGRGEKALEEFARKTGKLKKGGEPNIEEAARMILRKWQRGEI